MTLATSAPTTLDELTAAIAGQVIRPDDAGYDDARRVWLLNIDRRPAAIVRAANADDVSRVVRFAAASGLPLAVRGGGHSLAGWSMVDDGIVLDLGAMRGLRIDPDARLAWAEAGLTAMEYTAAAAEHGLVTGFGDTGTVGIAGLTLGGGIGYLSRKLGLTIDSLEEVDLVLADGSQVTASAASHPDLFWAVRGGGGNFGIATRFTFRLHDLGMVYGGAIALPATAEVIRAVTAIAEAAPDELTTINMILTLPPMPFLRPEDVGKLSVIVSLVHTGDQASAERDVAPLRALAEPYADLLGPMPYPAIYELFAEAAAPQAAVSRTFYLDTIDGDDASAIVAAMEQGGPLAMMQFRPLGGAIARVPADATAFAHRDAGVLMLYTAAYEAPEHRDATATWVEGAFAAFRGKARGAYVNFLEDEGPERVADAYPAATLERLAEVKRRYDPENLFRRNQNVKPATVPASV